MSKSLSTSAAMIRLYIITFLFFSANPVINIIVPLCSEGEGASNAQIGMMMGAYMMTSMIFRPWAGNVVQRLGPMLVLRILLLANMVILFLYTITDLEWYLIIRAMQGVATAFFSLTLQMGLVGMLQDNERSQGISLYLLAGMLPTVIGPIVALSIWNGAGMSGFAAAMIVIGLATGLIGYYARLPSATKGKEQKNAVEPFFAQIHQLWTNRAFIVSGTAMLIASVSFGSVVTFIALYVKKSGVGNAGLYLMLQAGVIVIARFMLRKKVPSDGNWSSKLVLMLLLSIAVGSQLLALAIYGGEGLMYAAAVLIGIGMALLYPTLMTYLTFVLPVASRNTLIGLFIAMSDLGVVVGNMAMGPIADHTSYSFMYMMCACLTFTAMLIVLFMGRRLT